MAVAESIEHKTVLKFMDKLVIAFSSSLASVANELIDKAVIPPKIHEYVPNAEEGDSHTKAAEMMMCVADQVRVCPGKYYDFMSMSVFEQAWIKSLRDDLTSEYGMICDFFKKFIIIIIFTFSEKLKAAAASQEGRDVVPVACI